MKLALVGACLLLASPALAQTTTNCNGYGNTINCTTTAPPTGPNWNLARPTPDFVGNAFDSYQRGQQAAQQRESSRRDQEQQRITEQQFYASQAAGLKLDRSMRVGQLMAQGDCKGAMNVALTEGDIELATRVKAFCETPAK